MEPEQKNASLLAEKMTRKQFITFVVGALISSFGVANFISQLMKHSRQPAARTTAVADKPSHGFGASKFGV